MKSDPTLKRRDAEKKPVTLTVLDTLEVLPPGAPPDPWARARRLVEGARFGAKLSVACQVMAGMELIDIRAQFGNHQGKRTDLPTSPRDGGKLNWEDHVKAELGIGAETARRWMEMAKAMKPRLKKLDGFSALPVLELPMGEWSPDQTSLLNDAVKKLTDGKSQADFLEELGVAKKAQGSGAKGGNHGGGKNEDPNDPAEVARVMIHVPVAELYTHVFDKHYPHLQAKEMAELAEMLSEMARKAKEAVKPKKEKRSAKLLTSK